MSCRIRVKFEPKAGPLSDLTEIEVESVTSPEAQMLLRKTLAMTGMLPPQLNPEIAVELEKAASCD